MRGDRLTEQESLHFGAAFGRDLVELFSGFDAFGSGHHAHSACERRDRPHDIERARVFRNVLYERAVRSEEHTSELQSRSDIVCRLLLEKKKTNQNCTLRTQPYASDMYCEMARPNP